jgi:hypothetical protein
LIGRQRPADGAEVLAQLGLVAGAQDDGRYGGASGQPLQGDLGDGLVGLERDLREGVDDAIEQLIIDGRAERGGVMEADRIKRLREVPAWSGPSPMGRPSLVEISARWRRPSSAAPRISSEAPLE